MSHLLLRIKIFEIRRSWKWLRWVVRILSFVVGQPPCLTYEEIVIINARRRRLLTFTGSRWERIFYLAHARIEDEFERLFKLLLPVESTIISDGWAWGVATRPCSLTEADTPQLMSQLRKVAATTFREFARLARMPTAEFTAFRPYLMSRNGHPGPSGAFSPSLALLQFLLFGPEDGKLAEYVQANLRYFPWWSHEPLISAISGPVLAVDPKFKHEAAAVLFDLRVRHFRMISKHLPGVTKNNEDGSAMPNARAFLNGRIKHGPRP